MFKKKKKVIEVRHGKGNKPIGKAPEPTPPPPVVNPLQSQINDLRASMIYQVVLNEEIREKVAKLENDRDTIFEVLKRPVTLFFNADKEVM